MFHNTFQSGVISILSAYGSHPLQLWDICLEKSDESKDCGVMIRRIRVDENDSENDNINGANKDKVAGPFIEITSTRLSQNYMICPPNPKAKISSSSQRPSLGITLPYLYMTIHIPNKEMDFSFEVTILDDKQMIRRFRASTYQSTTVIKSDICTLPLKLEREQRRLTRDALLFPAKKQKHDSDHNNNPCAVDDTSCGNSTNYYGPCGGNGNTSAGDDEDDNNYDHDEKISCWNRVCIPLAEYTKRAYGTNYVETMWVQIHANCRLKRVYFAEKEINEDDELPEEYRLYQCPSS